MSPNWGVESVASLAGVVQDDLEPDHLASHLALNILGSLECRAVALGVIRKEGFLDLIGYYGLSEETTSPYIHMPLWTQLPMTDAARKGEFIFIKSYEEFVEQYPTMVESIEYKDAVTVAIPVKHRNAVIGSVAFSATRSPKDDFESNPMTDAVLSLISVYMKNYIDKRVDQDKDHSVAVKSLSPRQKQIIKLFKDELTTEQMAHRLRFSPSTIKQDIIKIYELFGVHSREQVVILAERAGLLESVKNS